MRLGAHRRTLVRRCPASVRHQLGGGPVNDASTDVRVSWLSPSAVPLPGVPGGSVPLDDELLEQTLAFSGSYVSDDGTVTITRSVVDASAYSGDRFVGRCTVCATALLVPADGEPLADVREAVRFVSTHDHGGLD
jgi:hypothetical protein